MKDCPLLSYTCFSYLFISYKWVSCKFSNRIICIHHSFIHLVVQPILFILTLFCYLFAALETKYIFMTSHRFFVVSALVFSDCGPTLQSNFSEARHIHYLKSLMKLWLFKTPFNYFFHILGRALRKGTTA